MVDLNTDMLVAIVESKNSKVKKERVLLSGHHESRTFLPCEAGRLPVSKSGPVRASCEQERKSLWNSATSSPQHQPQASKSKLTNTSSFVVV